MADAKPSFTDEATAEYALAVTRYTDNLEAIAKAKCSAEVVLVEHVRAAIAELGPGSMPEVFDRVLDWTKRVAFLFVGFSVVQGAGVLDQKDDIVRGSVVWLVVDVLVAALLIGIALAMDLPSVRKRFRKEP